MALYLYTEKSIKKIFLTTAFCFSQKFFRGHKARKLARNLRMMRAAVVLQKMFKRFRAQIKFRKIIRGVIRIQSVYRGMQARAMAKDMRRVNAALRIQRCWRMHKFRKEFVRVKKAVITIQTAYRAMVSGLILRCQGPRILESSCVPDNIVKGLC